MVGVVGHISSAKVEPGTAAAGPLSAPRTECEVAGQSYYNAVRVVSPRQKVQEAGERRKQGPLPLTRFPAELHFGDETPIPAADSQAGSESESESA